MENLVIEIGANTQEFLASLGEVGENTKSLGDQLTAIGTTAGIAFAGYTASIMASVYAYREQEKVGQEINAILTATGGVAGVTSEMVDGLATSLSSSTTFSKLQVEQGEKVLLTFNRIGKETFPLATQATLDLAQKMGGDTAGAAQMLGRALQDPMNGMLMLRRQGILFTQQQKDQITAMEMSGDMAGAQAIILKQVESQYGGMAQAAAGGTGSILQLKNMMEEFAEKVGAEFAPYIAAAANGLKSLIQTAEENEPLVKFIAFGTAAAAGVTGLITALVAGAAAFKQIMGAMELAGTVAEALGITMQGALVASGIGLVLIAATELYLHWSQIWPAMQAVFQAFMNQAGQLFKGLGMMILGAVTVSPALIKQGWDIAAQAVQQGVEQVKDKLKIAPTPDVKKAEDAGRTVASASNKAYQQQMMIEEDATRKLQFAAEQAANQAKILQMQGHTSQVVDLKKKEGEILNQLATEQNATVKAGLTKALAETQAMYQTSFANEGALKQANDDLQALQQDGASKNLIDLKKKEIQTLTQMDATADSGKLAVLKAQLQNEQNDYQAAYKAETAARDKFDKTILEKDRTFQSMSYKERVKFLKQNETALFASYQTEEQAQMAVATKEIQAQIQSHNTLLQETVQYGAAYATISQVMHSTELTQLQTSIQQIESLQNSKNSTLKAIGQAAAVADITISSARGAMAAYSGFVSALGIYGIPPGIAAAAAMIAYGVERVEQVYSAAEGGLITGGVPGVDSILVAAQHGELVVPPQSYEEVVSSVADSRNGTQGGVGPAGSSQPQQVNVVIELKGDASRVLSVQQRRDSALGTYRGVGR